MDATIVISLTIIIILMWFYWREHGTILPTQQSPTEPVMNLVYKYVPREQAATQDAITIDAIPMEEKVEPEFAEDVDVRVIQADQKPPVSLTFDASVARNAIMRSRDKRVFDAIANRTADYWKPIFEEEIRQCEYRDWWDDVAYPINDSGEYPGISI